MANRPQAGRLGRADRVDETHRLRAQGLTHREIAERLDVSVSTVANDLRASPSEASAAAISSSGDGRTAAQHTDGNAGALLSSLRAVIDAARRRLP